MPYARVADRYAYGKKYRLENREKAGEYDSRYREENREKLLAAKREYYQKNKEWIKQANKKYRNKRRVITKIQAIEYKGGKCARCGYSGCKAAMHFHHIDPAEKDRDWQQIKDRSFQGMKRELDKCVLLCANCHAEVHFPDSAQEENNDALQSEEGWWWD